MKHFIFLICSVILFSCSFKSNRGTYQVNIVCNTTDSLKISSIELTNELLKLSFKLIEILNVMLILQVVKKHFLLKMHHQIKLLNY